LCLEWVADQWVKDTVFNLNWDNSAPSREKQNEIGSLLPAVYKNPLLAAKLREMKIYEDIFVTWG
jgi:hypothetical protein